MKVYQSVQFKILYFFNILLTTSFITLYNYVGNNKLWQAGPNLDGLVECLDKKNTKLLLTDLEIII